MEMFVWLHFFSAISYSQWQYLHMGNGESRSIDSLYGFFRVNIYYRGKLGYEYHFEVLRPILDSYGQLERVARNFEFGCVVINVVKSCST